MTKARQDRVVALLSRDGDWMTAATLADAIGVTPRSIRTYVTAINARITGDDAIESGPHGYRLSINALPQLRGEQEHGTPRDRLHRLVRALLDAPEGVDLEQVANSLFVSFATVETDLTRVRALLASDGATGDSLTLERHALRVRLRGSEGAQRRLLSRLVHDELDAASLDLSTLRRAVGGDQVSADSLSAFKGALVEELAGGGFFVNEYGMTDVLLHVAIAVDRTSRHRKIAAGAPAAGADAGVAAIVERLAFEHFGVDVGPTEARHLAALLMTRVVGRGDRADALDRLDPEVERVVRAAVARTSAEFDVDLMHEDFIMRLALHTQNLLVRASAGAWSRNPLTRSIKSSYPMIFELAVFLAHQLQSPLGFELHDDELAYIAMHVGGRLEKSRRAAAVVTAAIVCPGYYELHELLRSSIDRSLGSQIEVVAVESRADADWTGTGADLVITTVAPPDDVRAVLADRIVRVQPFLTEADADRIRQAEARVRRGRRLERLRTELEQYFSEAAFVRGLDPDDDEETVIRRLGAMLRDEGVIDDDYIERTVERERMSSTAFTDALAVPHALTMTAKRTAIAIAVAEQSVPWGDRRVQVVALVGFSERDRAAFQTVFEQLVEVFSERESVQRIVRRGTDFPGFLDELVAVIDG